MKKFYPSTLCAIVLSSLLGFSISASAQTYAHTYKTTPVLAIGASNWSAGAGTPIWDGTTGQPPSTCSNCLIELIGPGVVHMNTSITLNNNSSLVIGSGVTLVFDPSGATNTFTGANDIIMPQNNTENNTIVLTDNTSTLDASNTNLSQYDGVFFTLATTPVVSLKQFGTYGNGNAYSFTGNTINGTTGAAFPSPKTGSSTLNSSSGILPIILSSFNAVLNDGAVDLAWTTATESNSDHFSVQRSTNAGASWNEIGTVAAAGNSSVSLNYSFTDTKPAQGTSEYRLQLVDKDGSYTYSDVKAVTQGIVTGVSIYPNPARDYVNITLSGTAGESMLIRLFNASGALLQERNVTNAGGTTVPLAVSSYPEGNYLIVVSASDGSRQISKLLITK
jgi:hypothetical protein